MKISRFPSKGFCACQGLRRRGASMCSRDIDTGCVALFCSVGRKTSAPRTCLTPLNTSPAPSPVNASRLPSQAARASVRGGCGSLRLHRDGLPPSTSCRSPGAPVETFGRAKDQWRGKIVIDATNAYDVRPEFLAGRLSSDIVAAALPGAAVVKAFNHLNAAVLARDPSQNGGRRVVFISSNDDAAANEVKILAEQLGFSPILLGRIDEGGRLLQIDGGQILHNLVEWPFK